MSSTTATIFGGTGFLGREITRTLVRAGWEVRVASRRPPGEPLAVDGKPARHVTADIRDEASVAEAVRDSVAVVNAVSLYAEKGGATFEAIHVEGAERLARCAKQAGARVLVHVSGLGVDPESKSKYVRTRAIGEERVRRAFPECAIVRPSVLFGPNDSFLGTLERTTRIPPLVPLFGRGETRLQPVYVKDVAAAVAAIVRANGSQTGVFELGGAQVLTFRQVLERVLARLGRRRWLMPVPFPIWRAMAALLSPLPSPPLTLDQVMLMEQDNVVSDRVPGFSELGLTPAAFDQTLQTLPLP